MGRIPDGSQAWNEATSLIDHTIEELASNFADNKICREFGR
jgi:hypothetical protein